jgi:hypothetical protein
VTSSESPRGDALRLFLLSFVALFLEMMVIRWEPSVVRMLAYYANLMLISSFLGLGLGAMIGRKRGSLFGWLPVLIALNIGLLVLSRDLTLPSNNSEHRFWAHGARAVNYLVLVGLFVANAAVFVPLGQRIGQLFEKLPPLRAYSWDLLGSFAGTIAFGVFSFLHFSPILGFGVVAVIVLALSPPRSWLWAAPVLALVLWEVGHSNDPNAIWSPYYYVTVHESGSGANWAENNRNLSVRDPVANVRTMQDPPAYTVSVNHDFYQPHATLDLRRFSDSNRSSIEAGRQAYDLPYKIAPSHDKVLVLGAGGGTDAEVAVLNGATHVDAVEIDPVLVQLSRRFNPSGIYDDPRVTLHVGDARAYVRRSVGGYDMVVFGWLDSQALFSSMSNIRLDGYVYTVESMRWAYGLLNDHGTLSLSFATGAPWMSDKLVRMLAEATGRTPVAYQAAQAVIITVSKGTAAVTPDTLGRFVRRSAVVANGPGAAKESEPPHDDWPFLYLSGRQIPIDYVIVIGMLLLLSLATIRMIRGGRLGVNDQHFLWLGLAFLLLETKSITDCSLYFGSTWAVALVVISGVLLMVLAANLAAMRIAAFSTWLYAPLIAALLLLIFVPRDTVLGLDMAYRLAWALLVMPLPLFFAGLIFSTTLRDQPNAAALFGANLIGAMIGGFCEYLSMLTGNSSLMALVIAAYLMSLLCRVRMARGGTSVGAAH